VLVILELIVRGVQAALTACCSRHKAELESCGVQVRLVKCLAAGTCCAAPLNCNAVGTDYLLSSTGSPRFAGALLWQAGDQHSMLVRSCCGIRALKSLS
jgi:hypothetical protein